MFLVEYWIYSDGKDPMLAHMVDCKECTDQEEAKCWAWDRLKEGYAVRVFQEKI